MRGIRRADVLLYFKCPTTKEIRCPVNAYHVFIRGTGKFPIHKWPNAVLPSQPFWKP